MRIGFLAQFARPFEGFVFCKTRRHRSSDFQRFVSFSVQISSLRGFDDDAGLFHAMQLLRWHLLWLEPASMGDRIILLADNVILDNVYRRPCGKAAQDDEATDQGYKVAF